VSAIEYREYTLLCDGSAGLCTAQYGPFGVERTRSELRKLATGDGWTHVRVDWGGPRYDKDYCPAHKPAETSP
jgi:hypothetical protein